MLLGPPGAGKGTQAQLLVERLSIPQISVGDILRKAVADGGELGRIAHEIMSEGRLGPDEVIMDLVKKRIDMDDCRGGYILDGFPRTIPQAVLMERLGNIDMVINLVVPTEILVGRLTSRRNCRNCSAVYNLSDKKPTSPGKCDLCGGELYRRNDDNEETISKRLETYVEQTEPLIDHYRKVGTLGDIPGGRSIEETFNKIMRLIDGA